MHTNALISPHNIAFASFFEKQAMKIMGLQILDTMGVIIFVLIMFVLTITLSSASLLSNFPVAKPKCVEHCGNISIPFPFGTTKDCYRGDDGSTSFLVTCNKTFHPPKLFLHNTSIEIIDISLNGQLRVMQSVAKHCHDQNGNTKFNVESVIELPQGLTVDNIANKFTVIGCDSLGIMRIQQNIVTVCYAYCNTIYHDWSGGPCRGHQGCCQTSIPQDLSTVRIDPAASSGDLNVHTRNKLWNFNNCTYAFLVEESAFNFSPHNLTKIRNVEELPMVVDWAFHPQRTCKEAQEYYLPTYACKGLNSECYRPNHGRGYLCQCKHGYEGNPYLIDGCKDKDECKRNICVKRCVNTQGGFYCSCPKGYRGDGRRDGTGCVHDELPLYKIATGIAIGITVLVFIGCWLYVVLKKRKLSKMRQKYFDQNGGVLLQEKLARLETSPVSVSIFNSFDLRKATNNFHRSMIIGQGGFGTVYRGSLTDNAIVAVKKSKKVDPDQNEQFINEVIVLSQINHRNVVKLIGCCLETKAPLLVYEFINNGTLFEHIHNRPNNTHNSLNWDLRLKIGIETASALSYLHSMASIPIIHRDVKSSNILLDDTFTAKVSDFGSSRLVPLDQTRLSTFVQGTFGYLDPEYMQTNQLTEKSDVYSFGVVLVELLTSMEALSYDRPEEERNLSNFFLSMIKKEQLFQILDGDIVCEENMDQLIEVAKIAEKCLNVRGEDRPSMKEVAMELEGLRLGEKRLCAQTEHAS